MFASKDTLLTRPSGYNIARSVRLRSSASAYLNRTQTSGNRRTYTYSAWVKRGNLTTKQNLFGSITYVPASQNDQSYWSFLADNTFEIALYSGGAYLGQLITTQVFRDPSAWYHIVVQVDTTQATSSNRLKLFVNGTQVTSFSTTNYPSQNTDTFINTDTYQVGIGRVAPYASSEYFDGYMTEINFIDGQALTPSSFGETDSITGVWKPKKYGGTYGTNGFYLNFSDNSNNTAATIGKDYSGNGNNWTPNNISVTAGVTYDSMTDVPTLTSATAANYCVMNPLDKRSIVTVSNGNLNIVSDTSGNWGQVRGTMAFPTSGKFYWEVTLSTTNTEDLSVGIGNDTTSLSLNFAPSSWANYYGILDNGDLYANNSSTSGYGSGFANGDVFMVAFDRDNSKIYFGKNGTWFNSSNPATQTNPAASSISTSLTFFPMTGSSGYVPPSGLHNFGQRPFSYTPPTGFVALNTYNLPASTIKNGAAYMAATLYSGTGGTISPTNTVNSVSFQPDWVWIKVRSTTYNHNLFDSVRGVQNVLNSNATYAENVSGAGDLTAFNSNGFTVRQTANYELSNASATYVAWQWKAGTTSASNTNGTITSTVSVGATQGFSVVTYTGNGTQPSTVGHGLGVAPSMVIIKTRNSALYDWNSYHISLGNTQYIALNTTAAASSAVSLWNNTTPTSTVFTVNHVAVNTSSNTYVAYCFAAVAGYSAFGSYTGNGSADGPFVYTGFRPRFVMIKGTSTDSWIIEDASRVPYNLVNLKLNPNSSAAEITTTGDPLDFLSNGFKCRGVGGDSNTSSNTYIYMAFAENPMKYALAR